MPYMIGATVAAPLVGGAIGSVASAGDRRAQRDAMSEMKGAYANLPQLSPEYTKLLALQQFQAGPQYNAQLENQMQLGPSAYQDVAQDPRTKAAQMEALLGLTQISQEGMGPQDRAAMQQMLSQVNNQTKARQEAIQQQYQAMGLGGGGAQLASELANAQGAANTSNANAMQLASDQANRRMAAIASLGGMGTQIAGQDLNQQLGKAGGLQQSQLQQFNANLGTQQRNVGAQNQGQQLNLGRQWDTSDRNVAAANQEQKDRLAREMGAAQYALGRATGQAGALGNLGNMYGQQAQNTAQTWTGIGSAIGQGTGAAYGYMNKNDTTKKS